MKKINLVLLIASIVLFYSCSDDDTSLVGPSGPECFLNAITDSSTKYTEIVYWNDELLKLQHYNFADGNKGELKSSVEYERNVYGDFNSIKYLDANGNLEGIDSIYRNSKGLISEVISYNSNYERLERVTLGYDELKNLVEERVFKFNINWIIKIETEYIYDNSNRVVTSVRKQITQNEPLIDSTFYTYDNMKNIESMTSLYTPFKKNNHLTVENVYYISSGKRFTETMSYEYEYNEKGYPVKTKITSSLPQNSDKYQYNIMDCTK